MRSRSSSNVGEAPHENTDGGFRSLQVREGYIGKVLQLPVCSVHRLCTGKVAMPCHGVSSICACCSCMFFHYVALVGLSRPRVRL